MKLRELLKEELSALNIFNETTWKNADAKLLADLYVSELAYAQKHNFAHQKPFQEQLTKLHSEIAKKLGSDRTYAALYISEHMAKADKRTRHKITNLYVVNIGKNECEIYEKNLMVSGKFVHWSSTISAPSFSEEEKTNWDWGTEGTKYLPRVKDAIDFLHIPYKKHSFVRGSFHEKFLYRSVIVSSSNALRIHEYILNH